MGYVSSPASFSSLTDVRVVVKTADETVNNATAMQDDDELFFTIQANEVWDVRLVGIFSQADANADWDVTFTVPAGASGGFGFRNMSNWVAFGTEFTSLRSAQNGPMDMNLYALVVNGATAGTVHFQWAQAVATPADSKVLANSFLVATRLK